MPTKKELVDIAKKSGIPIKAALKKQEIIDLLGNSVVRELDNAIELCDIKDKKGYIDEDRRQYDKILEKKQDGLYVAVLKHEKHLMVVKGVTSGKGLGNGGAKWRYTSIKL